MANFITALEALGTDRISLEVISYQLNQILDETPDYSQHLLSHLIKAKDDNIIELDDYRHLRQIIEPYLIEDHDNQINDDDVTLINFKTSQITQELTTGSIIKQRFKLLEILGVGGMGTVYKGIDLLKLEARDKNPYVALKLLNEDFKSHPQAFISLQRESSRQQKLAHPNIATVYDFDRVGGPGTPVFITMELLEGQTVNTFIKTRLRRIGGLPFSEAFKIIKQLASALSYAHERGIVHSDFKPGNAFICKDGTVKTLDFGIARAVKNPLNGVSERTLFDPRNLGAITPAYASMEMLLGKAPDTRDDIYALGCVAYELLTGKHPFDKLPATKVKEKSLAVEPVKGLKRNQNLTLQRALACHRDDRCQTVDEFVENLEARYVWYKDIRIVAAGLILLLVTALYVPVNNYLDQRQVKYITQQLQSADEELIEASLVELQQLDELQQITVTTAAKQALQNYFQRRIVALTNLEADTYHFPKAYQLLDTIQTLYPDSSFFMQQRQQVEDNKKEILSRFYKDTTSTITSVNDAQRLHQLLNTIRTRITPEHVLFSDRNIAESFRKLARRYLNDQQLSQATQVVNYALDFFSENQPLLDLQTEIKNQQLLNKAKQNLLAVDFDLTDLAQFLPYQDDIQTLARLQETDPVLTRVRQRVSVLIRDAIEKINQTSDISSAKTLHNNFQLLLSSLGLNDELIELQLLNLDSDSRQQIAQDILHENITAVRTLINQPDIDNPVWKKDINDRLSILSVLNNHSVEQVAIDEFKLQISKLYIEKALIAAQRTYFDRATKYLNIAKDYFDKPENFNDAAKKIEQAKVKYQTEQQVSAVKKEFDILVAANKLSAAVESYQTLISISNENDYFIDTEAPRRLSESFQWHARKASEDGDYAQALELADNGLEYYPFNRSLQIDREQYLVEHYSQQLNTVFENSSRFDTTDIGKKFGEIENINPSRYIQLRQASVDTLLTRINQLAKTDTPQAIRLAQNANIIFPGSAISQLLTKLQPQPWPEQSIANSLIDAGKFSAAMTLQQSVDDEYKAHPDVLAFNQTILEQTDLAKAAYAVYLEQHTQAGDDVEKLIAAQLQLQQARAIWTDNPDYLQADKAIQSSIIKLQAAPSVSVLQPEAVDLQQSKKPDSNKQEQGNDQATRPWQPVSNERECRSLYASYGKRAKAVCFDLVNHSWRGPLMVVIPPGSEIAEHYAISKYEISNNDYSKYCVLSSKCLPETNQNKQDFPVTNISIQQAQDYVNWLSKRTGKQYRIPTSKQWRHAASAAGKQPDTDFNCRLAVADKIIKGADIVSVKSGQSNGWGLKNYLGNVQEWTVDNGIILALGGAYSDALSKCSITLQRTHSGEADKLTGFRVVLTDILE